MVVSVEVTDCLGNFDLVNHDLALDKLLDPLRGDAFLLSVEPGFLLGQELLGDGPRNQAEVVLIWLDAHGLALELRVGDNRVEDGGSLLSRVEACRLAVSYEDLSAEGLLAARHDGPELCGGLLNGGHTCSLNVEMVSSANNLVAAEAVWAAVAFSVNVQFVEGVAEGLLDS